MWEIVRRAIKVGDRIKIKATGKICKVDRIRDDYSYTLYTCNGVGWFSSDQIEKVGAR